jgi:hypothetical protein
MTEKKKRRFSARQDFVNRVCAASLLTRRKSARLAMILWRMGPYSSKLAENECNRELTEREKERDSQMDARVVEIGKELGLKAYRQGDPRGWTIRVIVPRELANCWDGISCGCG